MRKPANSDSYLFNADPDPQNQWITTFLLRMTGYILLILTIVDLAALFIPPNFLDPTWDFETIGKIIARAPVPLIGFALIFSGGTRYRKSWETVCLHPLAIVGVVLGLVVMALAPIGIMSGIRVHHLNQKTYVERQTQQEQTFAAYRERFQGIPAQNVANLARSLNLRVPSSQENSGEALRKNVLGQLSNLEAATLKQSREQRQQEKQRVFRNIVKWAVSAVLSGFCLVYLGRGARRLLRLMDAEASKSR